MTPKEKCDELVEKFKDFVLYDFTTDDKPFFDYQKQCALIAVDVILNDIMFWWYTPNKESITGDMIYFITQKTYWKEVKTEINKL
jgi:hypothetical protein